MWKPKIFFSNQTFTLARRSFPLSVACNAALSLSLSLSLSLLKQTSVPPELEHAIILSFPPLTSNITVKTKTKLCYRIYTLWSERNPILPVYCISIHLDGKQLATRVVHILEEKEEEKCESNEPGEIAANATSYTTLFELVINCLHSPLGP